jgi:hypothetical protein
VRYVQPGLRARLGEQSISARIALADEFAVKSALIHFPPVTLQPQENGAVAALPRPTKGWGGFISLLGTDGFVELSAGPSGVRRNEVAPLYRT